MHLSTKPTKEILKMHIYLLMGFLHTLQILSGGLLLETRQQMKELQELLYLFTGGGITGLRISSECCGW